MILTQFVDSIWGIAIELILSTLFLIMLTCKFLGIDKRAKIKGEINWDFLLPVVFATADIVYTLFLLPKQLMP